MNALPVMGEIKAELILFKSLINNRYKIFAQSYETNKNLLIKNCLKIVKFADELELLL